MGWCDFLLGIRNLNVSRISILFIEFIHIQKKKYKIFEIYLSLVGYDAQVKHK